jgi:hypothetical protein
METMENIKERLTGNDGIEGRTTRNIEKVTASIPSITFLYLAGGSILAALTLKLMGRDSTANFVGEWAPTFLMLGVYNKIVKVMGSDKQESGAM